MTSEYKVRNEERLSTQRGSCQGEIHCCKLLAQNVGLKFVDEIGVIDAIDDRSDEVYLEVGLA
jgi:hypothetical protein